MDIGKNIHIKLYILVLSDKILISRYKSLLFLSISYTTILFIIYKILFSLK